MSFFSVAPDELTTGAAMVNGGARGGASAGVGSVAGAAASTPVAAAWDSFVERAGTATMAVDQVVGELANSLAAAGRAYARSDSTAATGLAAGR